MLHSVHVPPAESVTIFLFLGRQQPFKHERVMNYIPIGLNAWRLAAPGEASRGHAWVTYVGLLVPRENVTKATTAWLRMKPIPGSHYPQVFPIDVSITPVLLNGGPR